MFLLKNEVNNPAAINAPTDIISLENTKWNKFPTARMNIKYNTKRLCNIWLLNFVKSPERFIIWDNDFAIIYYAWRETSYVFDY